MFTLDGMSLHQYSQRFEESVLHINNDVRDSSSMFISHTMEDPMINRLTKQLSNVVDSGMKILITED
jgi:hypothetical protein